MDDTPTSRRRRSTGPRDDEDPLAIPSTSTPSSVTCPDCDRHFDSSKAMKVHVFRCHTANNSSVACPYCERTFDSSTAMRVHVHRAHKSESVAKNEEIDSPASPTCILCPDCERSFDSSKAMKVHVYRTHTIPNSAPNPANHRESLRNAALGKRKANRKTIDVAQAAIETIGIASQFTLQDEMPITESFSGRKSLISHATIDNLPTDPVTELADDTIQTEKKNIEPTPMLGIPETTGSTQSQIVTAVQPTKSKNPLLKWLTKPKVTVTTPEESLTKFRAMMKTRRSGNSKSSITSQQLQVKLPILYSLTSSPPSTIKTATPSSDVKSNTPISTIKRSPNLNISCPQRASISPLAMSNLSLNKSTKSDSPLSSAKGTSIDNLSPFTLSTLALNGSSRSRLGATTTTPRANESSTPESTPPTGGKEALEKKIIRQKLIAISGQVIKQCFESTKSLTGFRNIFSDEEIESIKESIIEYRRSKFTSENNVWVWNTEEKTTATIETDVKAQMSVCIKEQLKKRKRIWNEQLRRFAPHNCEAISQGAYLLDFAFSSDMKSFVYFIDVKEMFKCGRRWNDETNDEERDARAIVKEKWIHGIGRKGRPNFIKIKTPGYPEYFVAMSILKGGLEQEDMDLWTATMKKSGSNTLTLDEFIKPKDMDQWMLHRMRRKEMKEHPNLQIWESVLAEMEVSKMVDRSMKGVLRALVE